jgi:hypothetical protein
MRFRTGVFENFLPAGFAIVDGMAGSASDQARRFDPQIKLKGFDAKVLGWRGR